MGSNTAVTAGSVKIISCVSPSNYHSTDISFMKANSWTPETTGPSNKHGYGRLELNKVSVILNDSSSNFISR